MATPHIESKKEDIAKIVLMPGDPLRAKYIAEHFLENVTLVNHVRNVFAYTGEYKGVKVTIFASGMGISSMAIYAYELYHFYDVEKIIRIGSTGALVDSLNLYDIILVENSYTDSNFAKNFSDEDSKVAHASAILNEKIMKTSKRLNKKITKGDIFCSECFYHMMPQEKTSTYLGVEMESFALFHIAKCLNKEAATILTVSDSLIKNVKITSAEREKSFTSMMELALESIIS